MTYRVTTDNWKARVGEGDTITEEDYTPGAIQRALEQGYVEKVEREKSTVSGSESQFSSTGRDDESSGGAVGQPGSPGRGDATSQSPSGDEDAG